MSKIFLFAFISVMAAAIAALDYVSESRRLGLAAGEMSGRDYVDLVSLRLVSSGGAADTEGSRLLPRVDAEAPTAWKTEAARTDGGGRIALSFDLFGGKPIDVTAFKSTVRGAQPATTAAFAFAGGKGASRGSCITNGAFKRCRVGD